ncbi:MAG: hypothetical protein V2A34_04885, partial [Lentisphaerota bacterium]
MSAVLVAACLVCLLAGCSTPASRIKRNPALFNSYPVDVQEKIKQGKVDIGFTKDMVEMALDKPDRLYTRLTADGLSEVWSYTATYTTTERQAVTGNFQARDYNGSFRSFNDTVWVDVQQLHEYEKLRVEFANGRVKAVEKMEQ